MPTWNYIVAHAYGKLQVIEDEGWLQTHVEELTNQHEQNRAVPWKVSDAPVDYTAKLLKGIVGVEIELLATGRQVEARAEPSRGRSTRHHRRVESRARPFLSFDGGVFTND